MEKLKIFIVEDDPIIAADLEDRLLEMEYQISGTATAGEDALDFFIKNSPKNMLPDLVLMDIQLDGALDGIETARQIAQKLPDLPIIFLTSNSDDATFSRAKSVRPAAFLSKPFRGRDLKHAIELAISHSSKNQNQHVSTEENTFLLPDRVFLKINERMVRLFFRDILWVEADDYYCKIVTREREFLVGQTLKKFSEAIAGLPEMMRVHRSFVVNLQHIEEIGDVFIYINRQQIPVSKSGKEELLARLQKI